VTSITVQPATGALRARLRVPGDKSISHRALLLGALAEGTSTVRGVSTGDDVGRTAQAVMALGATIDGDAITGGRARLRAPHGVIDVGNSGTGIRLLAGLCAGVPGVSMLDGDESIRRRPMDRVVHPLRAMGADIEGEHAPLKIRGQLLRGIDYVMPVASAQVKSALLLAGLAAEGDTVVHEPVETRRHTEELLALAGIDVSIDGLRVRVRPGAVQPFTLDVPGDPSQAAFWLVAAAIVPGSEVTVENVYVGPARAAFVSVLRRMGADVDVVSGATGADVCVRHAALTGTEVGGPEVPGLIDEIPILAVAAAHAEGTTIFRDAGELRVKESDRVATTVEMLRALGAQCEPRDDGLVVAGTGGPLRGGTVASHGDHRIAMAAAIAGLRAGGSTTITGWDAVQTSYPGFEQDLRRCR
jgi:3-phosphoshikimate 1-carboxyvinyltransferase